jgi:hypothetical protein
VETDFDATLWMRRLATYAMTHTPGPQWSGKERADRAMQARLDGQWALQFAHLLDANPDMLGDDWMQGVSVSKSD